MNFCIQCIWIIFVIFCYVNRLVDANDQNNKIPNGIEVIASDEAGNSDDGGADKIRNSNFMHSTANRTFEHFIYSSEEENDGGAVEENKSSRNSGFIENPTTNFKQTTQKPKRVKKIRRKKNRKNFLHKNKKKGKFSKSFTLEKASSYVDANENFKEINVDGRDNDAGKLSHFMALNYTIPVNSVRKPNVSEQHLEHKKNENKLYDGGKKSGRKRIFQERRSSRRKKITNLKKKRKLRKKKLSTTTAPSSTSIEPINTINSKIIPNETAKFTLLENTNQKSILLGLDDNNNNNKTNNVLSFDMEKDLMAVDGDLSCLKNGFRPAPYVPNAEIKYLRNDINGVENAFIEAEYICHKGFTLKKLNNFSQNSSSAAAATTKCYNVFCKNNKWMGNVPSCEKLSPTSADNEEYYKEKQNYCQAPNMCEQICHVENEREICSCYKGFRKHGDHCIDINECKDNGTICELGCINTMGSYHCKCPQGFNAGDNGNCIDINECRLRNGHGPCQDTCINFWGGYNCTCSGLPGTKLSNNRHSCEDLDECSFNNGGCSHTCLNTFGKAFCLCPEGWTLDKDWKTCVDIDECSSEEMLKNPELLCEYGCENTPGSYKCVTDFEADQPIIDDISICPNGFEYNTQTRDCSDIDECANANGDCNHLCTNTIGSFYCSCKSGYIFGGPDKLTCLAVSNETSGATCPPLFPPRHGYLECSRPTSKNIGRKRITNRPGSQCILRCPTGYRVSGKFSKVCGINGEWIGDGDGACIKYPTPKLICPNDIIYETPPNKTMAYIKIPKPKTDVNWERDIFADPFWAKNGTRTVNIGQQNISFIAKHPISKLTIFCNFTISVVVGEPPIVTYCPKTQRFSLNEKDEGIKVSWDEPSFADNINVTGVTRTNIPGSYFGVGSHQVIYTAHDAAGYKIKCVFKILVNVPNHRYFNHPLLPIYNYFKK